MAFPESATWQPAGKDCTVCGVWKVLTEFYAGTGRGRFGRRSECKECSRAGASARLAANYPNRDKERERERQRRYEQSDKGRTVSNAKSRRRQALVRGGGVIPVGWQSEQEKRQGGRCYYCQRKAKLTIEHLTPVKKGGTNAPDNLVLACLPCNASKQDKSIQDVGLLV